MSVEILSNGRLACLACNTTDVAFGPLFFMPDGAKDKYIDVAEYLLAFLKWLPEDARDYEHDKLNAKRFEFNDWLKTQTVCRGCAALCSINVEYCAVCLQEQEEEDAEFEARY